MWRFQAGILFISLHNLHGDGVEHSDKTLLFRGIGSWEVPYSIQGTMPIASLALNLDLGEKF